MCDQNNANTNFTWKICRVCLNPNVKLYPMIEFHLFEDYEFLTGIDTRPDTLSYFICWECSARLSAAVRFKNTALKSHNVLQLINDAVDIGAGDVLLIDRNNFTSSLSHKIFEANHADYQFVHADLGMKVTPKTDKINNYVHVNSHEEVILKTEKRVNDVHADLDEEVTPKSVEINKDVHVNSHEEVIRKTKEIDNVIHANLDEEVISMTDDIYNAVPDTNLEQGFETNDNFETSSEDDHDNMDTSCEEDLAELDNLKHTLDNFMKNRKRKSRKVEKPCKNNCENVEIESKSHFEEVSKNNAEEKRVVTKKATKVNKPFPPKTVLDQEIFEIKELSYEEQLEHMQKRLECKTYKIAPMKCDNCYKGFSDTNAYKHHMIKHSERSGEFECKLCKIRCKTKSKLRRHSLASHEQRFICKKCPFTTHARHVAKSHVEYHKGKEYQCPHCPEKFSHQTSYLNHARIKHPSDHVCQLCGFSFLSISGLMQHKRKKHCLHDQEVPPYGPICDKCNVQFLNKEVLERHMMLSPKHRVEMGSSKRYRNCPSSIVKRTIVTSEQNRPPSQEIDCEVCDAKLPNARSYYNHFRSHHPGATRTIYNAKATFMCEVCGRLFPCKTLLVDHSFSHSNTKQFTCSICDKSFQTKYRMFIHKRTTHTDTTKHACAECGKEFKYKYNLIRHKLLHKPELMKYPCDMCEKVFRNPSERKLHIACVHFKKPWPKKRKRINNTDNKNETQSVATKRRRKRAEPEKSQDSE